MRDSHYLAMLLGVAIFGALLLVVDGNWPAALFLLLGSGVYALLLKGELEEEQGEREGRR
ncbi:hypothetical protein [Pigmentiphaga kullae]|uniref:Uncharacterized protein n=1 Tax=Pigmentiphaga kullae TaxID=151784 RepID=A0A4Q7NCM3_9BURK|nr:hypothetical protein [Pigmentiphaga kullae]RZS80640.1 hypothetical protein EV675_3252 [Pigmentiphaga kullae]